MINKGVKKFISVLALIIVIVGLFNGCNLFSISNKLKTVTKYKFAMSIGDGILGDKAFNDSAKEGLEKAGKEFKSDVQVIDSLSSKEYKKDFEKLVKNSDLTFATGFKMKETLESVAKNNTDKNFVLIDETSQLPNVKSILFKDEEGAFLMGVIAGKMTKSNKVGFIGGVENVLIGKFETGFSAGVKAVNEKAFKDLDNRKNAKYITNFTDNDKSYDLAKFLYNNGVDVIFHAAGGAGLGVFKAAKENNKFAIGVDKDQALEYPEYEEVILSSMIKSVDIAVFTCIKDFINGNLSMGVENKLILGLKENGISVAISTNKKVPKEVIELVNKYSEAIKDGKLVIPTTPDQVKNFQVGI
ncbi:BMP family lipoprotein [Clostridium tarantellae]|uniref:BMP family ABC transporter substrate-binding protein n=1 Tax=Clostridium tarantellae TaxID=39493 RepID=A0A6I1MNW1_9CLOT|nr:BMP family ABC transporter substrate-binding protein [Clostridium tarantellae]MPQ44158.1 BMP family ABC transporter substrate-binding protein [Clostridium tarantellae]